MSISLSNETMSDGRYIIIIKFNILFLVFVDSDGTSCITPTFSFGANAVNRAYNIKVGMFPGQNSCLGTLNPFKAKYYIRLSPQKKKIE